MLLLSPGTRPDTYRCHREKVRVIVTHADMDSASRLRPLQFRNCHRLAQPIADSNVIGVTGKHTDCIPRAHARAGYINISLVRNLLGE
jgi:hypothetical protein